MAGLTPLPPSLVPIADNRVVTDGWYRFFQSLFKVVSAISTGVLSYSVSTALTATGTNQGTARVLTSDWNQFTTVAAGTGCMLFNSVGQSQSVFNNGANSLKIYPPSGGAIDALGTNNPFTLAVNKMQTFHHLSANVFESTQLG